MEIAEETEQMIDQKEPENPVSAVVDSKEMRAVVLTGFGGLNKLKVTKNQCQSLKKEKSKFA